MTEGNWQPLDFDEQTEWLAGPDPARGITGFDHNGWQAHIWIAHAMYEGPEVDTDQTHDERADRRWPSR